jgi:hypothetical protein
MTHKDLVEIGYRWLLKRGGCGVALKELKSMSAEIPDAIGFSSHHSHLIECKVSRSDFMKDKKKGHRAFGMGDYRYFICPTGLISVNELPEKWGLIYVSIEHKATCIKRPSWDLDKFEKDRLAEQQLMYSVLRRLFIKGFFPSVYDKDYTSLTNVDHLIALNEPKAKEAPHA